MLVLRALVEQQLAGVLVVSMPTLNGRWRHAAWPDVDWAAGGRTAAARRLNLRVRTISRVIVEPRCRGMGVATKLVRSYLAGPLTARLSSTT